MSRPVNMVIPVDIRKVVGSTVHAKSIRVMAEAEYNRIYASQRINLLRSEEQVYAILA